MKGSETMTSAILRALVDLRDRQIQKARIQFSNRVSAIERNTDDPAGSDQFELVQKWHNRFDELETELDQDVKTAVKDEPMYELLKEVRGIGPLISAKLLAMIDIERANTVSALWRYAGYAVFDGKIERPVKGEALHYNKRLKTTMYLVATSFFKSSSPYRAIYDLWKVKYAEAHSDWTKLHCHLAAIRKMNMIFLQHLWLKWRQLEGLPVNRPYVHEHLGHVKVYEPEDFGWE